MSASASIRQPCGVAPIASPILRANSAPSTGPGLLPLPTRPRNRHNRADRYNPHGEEARQRRLEPRGPPVATSFETLASQAPQGEEIEPLATQKDQKREMRQIIRFGG